MKQIKSSAALKADARQQLLGKYKTVILAYLIMQFLISGCMNLAQAQVNLNTGAGMGIYYLIYFILLLLSAIFITGQNELYKNIARGLPYHVKDMWVGFHGLADHAILVHLIIFGLCLLAGIPFILSCAFMAYTKNYYLSLLVAATGIFFLVMSILLSIWYSQALYLITDYPDESALQLLKHSRALMKGHAGSYFYLLVSFIGIGRLVVLTFGIGILWAYPYFTATKTNYYLELTAPNPEEI